MTKLFRRKQPEEGKGQSEGVKGGRQRTLIEGFFGERNFRNRDSEEVLLGFCSVPTECERATFNFTSNSFIRKPEREIRITET